MILPVQIHAYESTRRTLADSRFSEGRPMPRRAFNYYIVAHFFLRPSLALGHPPNFRAELRKHLGANVCV